MSNPTNIKIRVRGSYRGTKFVYEDGDSAKGWPFIWNTDDPKDGVADYWWREGNMSCDCNRRQFLPDIEESIRCGEEICIDSIEPLNGLFAPIMLNETTEGHA